MTIRPRHRAPEPIGWKVILGAGLFGAGIVFVFGLAWMWRAGCITVTF